LANIYLFIIKLKGGKLEDLQKCLEDHVDTFRKKVDRKWASRMWVGADMDGKAYINKMWAFYRESRVVRKLCEISKEEQAKQFQKVGSDPVWP
jgi:hypothetical protein